MDTKVQANLETIQQNTTWQVLITKATMNSNELSNWWLIASMLPLMDLISTSLKISSILFVLKIPEMW